jgi:hypothetical protein
MSQQSDSSSSGRAAPGRSAWACLQLAALQSHLLRELLRARLRECRVEGRQCLGRHEGLLLVLPALVHHQPSGARRRLRSTQPCFVDTQLKSVAAVADGQAL